MMTFWNGVKLKHVTLLLIAYVTAGAGLVAAQEPLEVPTNNQEGRELVVSDLEVERRLDPVFDTGDLTNSLKAAFKDLEDDLLPFSRNDAGDLHQVLADKIPFVGKSVNELVAEQSTSIDGIDDVFQIAQYVENGLSDFSNANYTLSDAQTIMSELFVRYVRSLTGEVKDGGCDPISLVATSDVDSLTLRVCAEWEFDGTMALSGDGLFDAIDSFAEIDLQLDLGIKAGVSFSAEFTLNLNPSGAEPRALLTRLYPVKFLLGGSVSTQLTFAVGMLELTSNADVAVTGEFELTIRDNGASECEGEAKAFGNYTGVTDALCLKRNVGYTIAGEINVESMSPIPGLVLPLGADFAINEASVFDPAPDITFPGIPNLDLSSFLEFSPQNGVLLLTKIDSALIRAQENEAFDLNIPFTDLTFSRILATGSVVTSKLLELFVRPDHFGDREYKSLDLKATKTVENSKNKLPTDGKMLEFYFLAQTVPPTGNPDRLLIENPENQEGVRDITLLKVCEMMLSTNYTDDQEFADGLILGINTGSSCGIKACKKEDCDTYDDANGIRCDSSENCDVLIDVNDAGFVSIASVAFRGQQVEIDVQLFGLYEPFSKTNAPVSLFGFPLNQPTFPNLVPQFRNLNDFTDLINRAIRSRFTAVDIVLKYVPASDSAARFELKISFDHQLDATVQFDGSIGVGDLIDISTVGNATLEVNADFSVSTVLAVIFEPNVDEKLVLIGNACGKSTNATFTCDLEPVTFKLKIGEDSEMVEYVITTAAGTDASATAALRTALLASMPDDNVRPNVTEVGANVLTLSFPEATSSVKLEVDKNCISDAVQNATAPTILYCNDGKRTYKVFNSYGLTDDTLSKRGFQIAVGDTSISAGFEIAGDVIMAANVGGVIEVEADLTSSLSGKLELTLGTPGAFLRFSKWLAALISIFNTASEGHRVDFFKPTASFEANFSASVQALAPFDIIPEIEVSGAFADTFDIDFFFVKNASLPSVSRKLPNVTFEVDLPDIGGLRNLSLQDVVELLGQVLEFLIGAEADQTPTSCSGGLLGMKIADQAVFSYQVPVLGLSACSSARFLQVFVDAVDDLTKGGNATFNSLEVKLEALLQDGVGGTPSVNLLTKYDNETGIAELLLDITLAWSTTESTTLNADLSNLLDTSDEEDEEDKANIQRFVKEFVPAKGQAQLVVYGGLSVTLAVGVEYRSNTSEVLPFIVGTTGVQVDIRAEAAVDFEARIGPLGAEVGATITVRGENKGENDNGPLSIRAGLDPKKSYYVGPEPIDPDFRPDFNHTGVSGLVDALEVTFDGRVEAILVAEVPLVGMKAVINVTVASVGDLFKNITENNLFANVTDFKRPTLEIPSFIDILLADPDALVAGLDSVFEQAEAASLGPNGIITNFPAPFISEKLGAALGANTKDNVLAQARSAIIPKLKAELEGFVGPSDTVADVLARVIEKVLRERPEDNFLGLIKAEDSVTTTCYEYNEEDVKQDGYSCTYATENKDSVNVTSIMWTIPFGQKFVIELPLDFRLDDDFPFEIALGSEETPELSIGWSFNLAFGYDETEGFFLYTFPGPEECSEFAIEALLTVENASINASLFFLDVALTKMNINLGAQLFVDFDKESALRKTDLPGPNYGRLTQGDFSKITQISDLFVIGAIAGATLEIEQGVISLDLDESVNKYIPRLNFGVAAHFRKELVLKESANVTDAVGSRRLLHVGNRRLVGKIHEGSDHPALPLLRSLGECGNEADANRVADKDFEFKKCPADGIEKIACVVLTNITLQADGIKELVEPIVNEFVNVEKDGLLDEIVRPLEPLREPIPGVSEITGKAVSVLDIAEAFDGAGSGVQTVRTMFKIYDGMSELAKTLAELEGVLLAETCDVLAGFNCTGGLKGGDDDEERRLVETTYYDPFGSSIDAFGLPMTPRILAACPAPDADCLPAKAPASCTKVQKAKFNAARLKCKAGSIEGLSFPILSNPLDALELLSGGDIQILDFSPPEIVFAFSYEQFFVLYTPPTCTLTIGFEFSVRLRAGFVLDTKGIREAVGPPVDILKALNSFALKDLFDGVDEPLIVITATLTVEIAASAAIIKISATGGITFVVTIDFYDPFPETSEGLIRPFQMLSLGTNPLTWFEIELSITLSLRISIEIGLYLGFVEITLFEYGIEFLIEIVAGLRFEPDPIQSLVELDVLTGELSLIANRLKDNKLECFHRGGDIGNEEIECKTGDLVRTFSGVTKLHGTPDSRRALEEYAPSTALVDYNPSRALDASVVTLSFECVESPIDMENFGGFESMNFLYEKCASVVSTRAFIKANEFLAGKARTTFDPTQLSFAKFYTPKPEVLVFSTVFESNCNSQWDIVGYSNIEVKANELEADCEITALGTFTNATLKIFLGSDDLGSGIDPASTAPCEAMEKSKVLLFTLGDLTIARIEPYHLQDFTTSADPVSIDVKVGKQFTNIEVYGSKCHDEITLQNTFDGGSVYIDGLGGDDTIRIGGDGDTMGDLDSIQKTVYVSGGSGNDTLIVDDSKSQFSKAEGVLDGGSLLQMLNGGGGADGGNRKSPDLSYKTFEIVTVHLSTDKANTFSVTSTFEGSMTNVYGGDQDDVIYVNETQGDILVMGGEKDDTFYFTGLGDFATATVYGEDGNDDLFVDGSDPTILDEPVNKFDNGRVRWSGGLGNDTLTAVLTSSGTSNIDLFNDAADGEVNEVFLSCTNFPCFILSRENFLANIHDEDDASSSVERINIEREVDANGDVTDAPSARINKIFLSLKDGNNTMFFDDTITIMDVFGGPDTDQFRIGQLYNSERSQGYHLKASDPITTTLTTRGYLSDGNNHPITLNGEFGGDLFDVLRNKKVLDLNGGPGDDTFVVRSFVNLPISGNGTVLPADVEKVTIGGGDGNDGVNVGKSLTGDNTTETENFSARGENPDYLINSLVDVDGGTGTDTLVVVGTEFDDSYVVTDRNVYGGGLSIKFVNIELLEVSCQEGNDLVSVLSTAPGVETKMYGSLGSDEFVVTPRNVEPVASKNLRGHRGILEHAISSNDTDYDKLLIEGVAVEVLDNDGDYGYINIVGFEVFHLLDEEGTASFSFTVFPTRELLPNTIVAVDLVPPSAINAKNYLTLNGLGVLPLQFTSMVPKTVVVRYNTADNPTPLAITDFDLMIKIDLNIEGTSDERFKGTQQSILPVDVKLLPGKANLKAKSVTVFQPTGRTVVAEGEMGFNATYNVLLRPCTEAMAKETKVTIGQSVTRQLGLSQFEIQNDATSWNLAGGCNVAITVFPFDDIDQEGDHFVTLSHVVTNSTDDPVLLSDNSTLFASNVLVRIYDDDIGSVIIQETLAVTSTAEMEETDKGTLNFDKALYEDEYSVRLTKKPTGDVSITVDSIPTATDRNLTSTAELKRDFSKRIQAHVGIPDGDDPAESVTIVFTNENWNVWQPIRVTAFNDNITEGVDLFPFPSQPSYLSFIQGPISLLGGASASFPAISDPFMLPGENDTEVFTPPAGAVVDDSSLLAIEEKQVDTLRIYNTDVRGDGTSNGTLTKTQLVGFNMGRNIVINGKEMLDGIEYSGMEVVEIFLGDGKDMVIVEDTTGAIHLLDTGGGDDSVRIKDISGPFIIHGQDGADVVTVSSTENKLDRIEALLAFDGGIDEEVDELNVDNSGSDEEDILFVSRQMVEFENLMPENATNLTLPDSFLIDLRYATEGAFILQFNENEEESKNEGGSSSIIVPYPINATDLESLIQRSLIPKDVELDSCGKNETTKCSLAVKVYEIGQTFAVFFVGERLNTGLNVTLDVGDLESNSKPFVPEVFDDATVNLLKRNSDIAYANLEVLDIKTGTGAALVNVRGTSVTTTITTQDKDDLVFISSEASQVNLETAASLEFLTGWLDYLEFDLTVNVGIGRHRLLISDENSTVSKGGVDNAAGPAELTWESLTKISDILGDFYYTAEGGNWSAGVNLWLGKGDDRLNVLSVPSNPGSTTLRTTTTVRAGPGEDTINIALREEDHQGTVFVANGEADNDVIDASQSTLGVILFGDGGDDRIVGGFGRDILFGDFGRVVWKSFNENIFAHVGVVIAVAGGGGYGDFTDGIVRTISEIFSISADLGGFDNLSLGSGDDIGIGGPFDDIIEGDDGNDILFGDSAEIQFHKNMTSPKRLLSTNCIHGGSDTLYGGPGVVNYLVGGSEGDKIYGNVSMDLAFGDHADIKLFEMSHQLSTAETIDGSCAGGIDTIRLGPGDDLAFGGAMGDIIYGDEGQDVIFGDFGRYDAQIEFLPFQNYRPIIGFSAHGGDDTIYGGADDDFIMGQEGSDTIYGESGRDDIYGGHSLRHGQDAGDTLNGGDHDDVILGDNGQIVRHRINFSSAYPWINGMVWETWPAPFDTEAIRGVRRYDDIDFIEGNDRIYGEAGNDILHGQRGDDYISGGSGEDEIYGELGSDILDGNSGNDILLGDVGYIVRRIDSQGVPILITKTDNADSTKVWKKDIVLEEVGNIEARHRISRKVNTAELLAEDVTSSSLLFVANAFDKDGDKYFDGDEWLTDLLLFKLNSVPDDDIIDGGEGDDVCIGQRGDDTLQGGLGNDLLIGDGGTNVIAQTMDMPRIYQVYRTLSFPDDSEFVNATDFGAVFSADYELYPQQYRSVDYLSSLVDLVVNVDDLQEKSNLLSDIIGVSALSTTDEYCMQPMFRITPGFLYETQKLHGNDMLTSGPGDSILIGDDIRGFTALDLTTELASASVIRRQKLDNLVVDLSVRMSTLEVDTEFFLKGKNADSNNADFNIIVGQDDITTDELGRHFVAGDSLTIIARSVRGGSLDPGNADATAKAILERLHDVEQVFHQVHLAMYEVHNDILSRAIDDAVSYESTSQHALFLANDRIDAKGDGDFVFGDSSTLFFQAHRPDIEGFEFEVFNGDILGMASSIQTSRDAELKDYVENILNPSKSLSDFTLKSLLFEDVPFLVTVGCDTIMLQGKDSLGVGDFGVMGLTSTSSGPPVIIGKYGASIEELRKRPSKDSVAFQLRLSQVPSGKMDFYYERYDQTVTDTIHDSDLTKSRSDQFVAESSSSAILGEYFTGYAYGQKGSLDSTFQLDTTVNAFDATCVLPGRRLVAVKDELRGSRGSEDRSLQFTDGGRCIRIYGFDGDNFDIVDGTIVDGQRGEDTFVIDDVAINGNPASGDGTPGRAGTLAQLKTRLTSLTQGLFVNHALIIQMNEDIFNATILPTTLSGLKTDVCTDSIESTYIPPIEDYIHPIAVTPLPTPLPTPSPTGATPGPTPSPTTPGQTHSPTSVPTSVPTSDPTSDPTPDPTHSPTPGPTNDSTPVPTQVPTSDPTPVPTSDPTSDPTPVPTSDPTPVPTSDPTSDPTPFPTSGPTPLQCLAKYSRCDRREAECCAGTSCRSRRRRGRSCQ